MPSLFDSLFTRSRSALSTLFGESVRFQGQADSEPRTITTIQCRLNGAFEQQGTAGDGTTDTLAVGVLKDAVLGIAAIQIGDKLWYDDERPFTFRGQRQNETSADWTLIFERKRQEVQKARQ